MVATTPALEDKLPVSHVSPSVARLLVLSNEPMFSSTLNKLLCPPVGPLLVSARSQVWQVDSASLAVEMISRFQTAQAERAPYALAIVDVVTTPTREVIRTIESLWKFDPDLQIVLCPGRLAAGVEEMIQDFEGSGNVTLLKQPFDRTEARLLLQLLVKKRETECLAHARSSELNDLVAQQTNQLEVKNNQLDAEIRRREMAEMELRGSEYRFELAFKAATIPMAILHTASRTFLEVNDSFARLTNMAREDILGRTAVDLGLVVREQDYDYLVQTALQAGRVRDFASRIQPRSGEARDILLSLESVVLGEEACVLVAVLDVTDQRKLELQLRQSQKMDAIGQLAAGVAHDFNNLLTIIHGHASLQLARPHQDEAMTHSLTQVKMAADRAATLTRQLLAFSRKQVMQFRPLNLNESITCSQAMLKRLLGETIRLEYDCTPDLPLVFADENSIDQVIMNLVVNARDAMPGGGTLRIATRVVELDAEDFRRSPEARPGQFVRLSVADNGCGMGDTVMTRMFEPFFTTKAQGKGTGLGLSTVYGIIKQHEGWIEVDSAPGLGTQFHVFLSRTEKQPEPADEMPNCPLNTIRAQDKETVLVVEDEPVLREFITAVLQSQGYIILSANDGLEALQVCRETPATIDLLLTDMVMPNGISGSKLAAQMLAQRKDLKVLYISGYSQELMENSSRLVAGVNFLPKPFDVNKLLRAVRSCLESKVLPTVRVTGLVGVGD